MFKPVNSDLARPAIFQAHTKENYVFQLTLGAAICGYHLWKIKRMTTKPVVRVDQVDPKSL